MDDASKDFPPTPGVETTKTAISGTWVERLENQLRLVSHRQVARVVAGPAAGQHFTVGGPTVRIGTAPGNDVMLADETVSRHHCEVRVTDGRLVIRDLGSTNGTWVDGVAVVEAFLEADSEIRLGQTELRIDTEQTSQPIAPSAERSFGQMRGRSDVMRHVFDILAKVADTNLTVLLTGETGTGKELAARALHDHSARKPGPFVVVDCGALQANLVEAELFGHERGAFTGADRARAGAFEAAAGGTVFLDEVGELPVGLQSRLLRVLERREVRRLGSLTTLDLDVRIVAATHRDLISMVDRGDFREDLFYRLSELAVRIPPLRERPGDVADLAEAWVAGSDDGARPVAEDPKKLTADALAYLAERTWPGNARQLRNLLRRVCALADGPVIGRDLIERVEALGRPAEAETAGGDERTVPLWDSLPVRAARDAWIQTLEGQYMESMVQRYGEDLDAIAEHMGMHRKSVFRLLRHHGLMKPAPARS